MPDFETTASTSRGFLDLNEAGQLIENWRRSYNQERLHGSLGYATPAEYAN